MVNLPMEAAGRLDDDPRTPFLRGAEALPVIAELPVLADCAPVRMRFVNTLVIRGRAFLSTHVDIQRVLAHVDSGNYHPLVPFVPNLMMIRSNSRHPYRTHGEEEGGPTKLVHGSNPWRTRSDPPSRRVRALRTPPSPQAKRRGRNPGKENIHVPWRRPRWPSYQQPTRPGSEGGTLDLFSS